MKLWKKITIISLSSILGLILILFIIIFGIWNKEIRSVASIDLLIDAKEENRSGAIYEMEMKGDYYFAKYLEEGGASSDDELINFILDNITKGIIKVDLSSPEIGCSSFTAQTEDGTRLFGRNYDFSTTTGMIVRTTASKDEVLDFGPRHATISSVDLQFLGLGDGLDTLIDKVTALAAPYAPLDGINDAGVSCGIYMSYQGGENVTSTNQNTNKPDLTSTTMLRMILDYADDVEEAVRLVEKFDLHDSATTSFHYMVADASGKSAILEWVPDEGVTNNEDLDGSARKLVVHYNDADEYLGEKEGKNDFQYVTNFIVNPNYYLNDSEKGGLDRYNEIERLINPDGTNTKGIISVEKALSILETVGRRKWDANQGESDSNGITVWSGLYDLTNKKVTWISNEEFDVPSSVLNFFFDGKKFVLE